MKIEIRRMIYKVPPIYNLCHEIVNLNNYIYYFVFNCFHMNKQKIKALKGLSYGKKCYIVGNGPSLSMEDLDLIKKEDCFASNLIFNIFNKTEWRPKYYFLQDRYADTENKLDELNLDYMFIGDYYWRKRGINNPSAICFHKSLSRNKEIVEFSKDISKRIIDHCSITYTMIQAAVYMGYQKIYLLGMDHSYALTFDSKGNVTEDFTVTNHIFQDKNPKNIIANIEGMNKAYLSAKRYADDHNIEIYNVTRGGKLEWFTRMSLEKSLEG